MMWVVVVRRRFGPLSEGVHCCRGSSRLAPGARAEAAERRWNKLNPMPEASAGDRSGYSSAGAMAGGRLTRECRVLRWPNPLRRPRRGRHFYLSPGRGRRLRRVRASVSRRGAWNMLGGRGGTVPIARVGPPSRSRSNATRRSPSPAAEQRPLPRGEVKIPSAPRSQERAGRRSTAGGSRSAARRADRPPA